MFSGFPRDLASAGGAGRGDCPEALVELLQMCSKLRQKRVAALLGENYAWRLSAYARMPAGRLGRRAHLAELLHLHDPFGAQDEAVHIPRPIVTRAAQDREHELPDGALAWGDRFTVEVDPAGCTDGALWLVGELVHRALAERNEALRYARLVLVKSGAPFAEYAPRQGARLPFPLG